MGNVEFIMQMQTHESRRLVMLRSYNVSKTDEFCIKNEEFCIENDEFCRNPTAAAGTARPRPRSKSPPAQPAASSASTALTRSLLANCNINAILFLNFY